MLLLKNRTEIKDNLISFKEAVCICQEPRLQSTRQRNFSIEGLKRRIETFGAMVMHKPMGRD